MSSWVLKNAVVVNEGRCSEADVGIVDGRIERVGGQVAIDGARELDLAGAWLLPGMIDDQVHFREPGFEHKGSIATESRAAIAGGITSYMEMPNCIPQTITAEALVDKHERAASRSVANYAFYFGATNHNLEAIKAVDTAKACGVKVFMGASTGNMLVDDEAALEGIFASCPLLIATHCEDTPTILANEARARERYGDEIPVHEHPAIRSEEACYKSSSLAVGLAKRHGSRLHVLHLTTAREMELFEPGPLSGKRITAEACVHHLFFNDSWYGTLGADIKCNPAIKSRADQLALRHAVVEDRIDVIATDHAPHTREEKAAASYAESPAGLPLVQHALLTLCRTRQGRRDDHRAGGAEDRPCARDPVRSRRARFHSGGLLGRPGRGRPRCGDGRGRRTRVRQVRLDALSWVHLPFPHRATFVNGNLAFDNTDGNAQLHDVPCGKPLTFER